MITVTARVAPEKAAFRPALPSRSYAGLQPEKTMATYAEMYRDPRWQRKRLEVMERAGFACQECSSTTKTLNVHHRLYRKGAAPWAYEDSELMCLCEDCHSEHHDHRKAIDAELAEADLFEIPILHALLVGFRMGMVAESGVPEKYVDKKLFPGDASVHAYWCGRVANAFADLGTEQVEDFFHLFRELNPEGFAEMVNKAHFRKK